MPDIHNPHDKFFKETFSHSDVARDFLFHYLPSALRDSINLSTLTLAKDTFADRSLQEQFSDLLFSVRMRTETQIYLYFLFEHKSYPEPLVAFHLLRYMVKIWEQDMKDSPKTLRPIIPIVIYHGEEEWNVPTNFHRIFHCDKSFNSFLPEFQYLLYDIPRFTEEEIKGETHLRVYFLLMKYVFHRDLKRHLGAILKLLQEVSDQENVENLFIVVINYLLNATDTLSYQDLVIEVESSLKEKGKNTMPTIAEQLRMEGKIEGKMEGKQEGWQEGKKEVINEILKHRFGAVSADTFHALDSISEINLLNQAVRMALAAASIEDFTEQVRTLTR